MYHLIEFRTSFLADVEVSPRDRLERTRIRKGTRARAQVGPRVVETAGGPVEVADLWFADGTVVREVPFHQFRFVDG
jgi:hypothetical protein